jgi:hypothetical protein
MNNKKLKIQGGAVPLVGNQVGPELEAVIDINSTVHIQTEIGVIEGIYKGECNVIGMGAIMTETQDPPFLVLVLKSKIISIGLKRKSSIIKPVRG